MECTFITTFKKYFSQNTCISGTQIVGLFEFENPNYPGKTTINTRTPSSDIYAEIGTALYQVSLHC